MTDTEQAILEEWREALPLVLEGNDPLRPGYRPDLYDADEEPET